MVYGIITSCIIFFIPYYACNEGIIDLRGYT